MLTYTYECPDCKASNTVGESDLQSVGEQILGTDRKCGYCDGWARLRVSGPYREFKVQACAAPMPR
jgi:hypothetical protein